MIEGLQNDIFDLVDLKQEGGYWDFKREWYSNHSDLLHDIICMANNLENHDGYIIIGIDESNDYSVCDVNSDSNRKNTQNIVDFLREKSFAGGIRPTIKVEGICFGDSEIDVIAIINDRHTPYYLSTSFQGLHANNIYVRVQDTNTPKDRSADICHVEYLWKKRFGIDANIMDRFNILLDQYDQWECDWGNKRYAYHRVFPEFKLVHDELQEGWESQCAFYLNPFMSFAKLRLMYLNTILYETTITTFDEFRVYLPYAKTSSLSQIQNFWYSYYDLTDIEGKLLKIMTSCSLNYHSREGNYVNFFLIFENNDAKDRFDIFAGEHFCDIDDSEINNKYNDYITKTFSKKFGNSFEEPIFKIAKASELYDRWLQSEAKIEVNA